MFGANRIKLSKETVNLNMKVDKSTKEEFIKVYNELSSGLDYHDKKYDFVINRLLELYVEFNSELEKRKEYDEREEARLETEAGHK